MFRLALALGKTVAQLDQELSPQEFDEWEAFYHFEPWGCPAADYRADVLARLNYIPNFKGDPPDFFDHDWQETRRLEEKRLASITLEDKVLSFFGGLNVIDGDAEEEPPVA